MTAVLDPGPTAATTPPPTANRRGWKRFVPAATIGGVGLFLTVAFFPQYFDRFPSYDDEGALLVTLKRFLDHGSLYNHTHGSYGPFYFSVTGAIFRVTGQSPTLFTGRVVALVFTLLSVMVFAATVWKVTRSLPMSVLCEVATFIVLIPYAGLQAMHPGPLIVLLVAVIGYGLASWAMARRTAYLIVVGVATGGLLMSKVNVGIFAIAAIVVAFVVGNGRYPRWLRILVGIGAVALPFVVANQLLSQMLTAQFIVLVSFTVLAVLVPLNADEITIPPRTLLVMAEAMIVTVVASWIWPLLTGTSPGRLIVGVFIQPLGQADHLTIPVHSTIPWLAVVVTLAGVYLVYARRQNGAFTNVSPPWLFDAALALAGVIVLGLGLFGGIAAWMPAIALLPAFAWLADLPRKIRLSLRFVVPLAVFQVLHLYPVAGSQRAWGLVAMCVPCVIALGVGLQRTNAWRQAHSSSRWIAAVALCTLVVVTAGLWPGKSWRDYAHGKSLGLPGARLVRLGEKPVETYQTLTSAVRKNCDTFYATPGFGSLYIWTGLPTPTGQLANWPGVLNNREQRDVAYSLRSLERHKSRVCIVRNDHTYPRWKHSSYGKGPLGKAVAPFQRPIAHVGNYTVLRIGKPDRRRQPVKKPAAGRKTKGKYVGG